MVGDTDLNTIGTDDFSNLISKLDKAYQIPNNYFVFNQQTQNLLRKMKDKYGRPIWETSLAQGEPDKIFGYRYTVDNAFANVGAGAVSAAFGDPSKYIVRRALGFTLVLFRELYMANYQRQLRRLRVLTPSCCSLRLGLTRFTRRANQSVGD